MAVSSTGVEGRIVRQFEHPHRAPLLELVVHAELQRHVAVGHLRGRSATRFPPTPRATRRWPVTRLQTRRRRRGWRRGSGRFWRRGGSGCGTGSCLYL